METKKMNLIVIFADTFRADYLGCYGNKWIRTPYLDAFAKESTVFDSFWGESLPTIEARKVYFTGRSLLPFDFTLPKRGIEPPLPGWGPMPESDIALSEVLSEQGYYTGLITDVWHYFKPNMNLHRGFKNWQFIRGQEGDPWRTGSSGKYNTHNYIPEHLWTEHYDSRTEQYLFNTEDRHSEEDYFCAQTYRTALRWLEDSINRKPFFLWADTFDPHEPFDPPKSYALQYYNNYPCERFIFAYGANHRAVREEDIPAIRGMYAGEVTLVDRWFGYLIEGIKRLGLYDDSIIIFTSDHGTEFGEHGLVQKQPQFLHRQNVQLPLIIHHPDPSLSGKHVKSLISCVDLMPTLLRLMNIKAPDGQMTGVDFWPAVMGEKDEVRDHIAVGWANYGAIRTHEWNYIFPTGGQDRAYLSRLRDLKGKLEKRLEYPLSIPKPLLPRLYNLKRDPKELTNVIEQYPDVLRRMQVWAKEVWPNVKF